MITAFTPASEKSTKSNSKNFDKEERNNSEMRQWSTSFDQFHLLWSGGPLSSTPTGPSWVGVTPNQCKTPNRIFPRRKVFTRKCMASTSTWDFVDDSPNKTFRFLIIIYLSDNNRRPHPPLPSQNNSTGPMAPRESTSTF